LVKFEALSKPIDANKINVVDMDYSGSISGGQIGSWGQTGCTVMYAIQTEGTKGTWAYCNHVRSMEYRIRGGMNQLCQLLDGRPNGIIVIVGTAGGLIYCEPLLKRLRITVGNWKVYYFAKPENSLEETLVDVETCRFEFPKNGTLNSDAGTRPSNYANVPYIAPPRPKPEWDTGFEQLDRALGTGKSKTNLWATLYSECSHWNAEILGSDHSSKLFKIELVEDSSIVEKMLTSLKQKKPEYLNMDVAKVLAKLQEILPDLAKN